MTQEVEPQAKTPENNLQRNTLEVFKQLIEDEENIHLWERFRFSYKTRGKLPFLEESKPGTEGLAHALSWSMLIYRSLSRKWLVERNEKNKMYLPIDHSFKQDLLTAAKKIVNDKFDMDGFAHSLTRDGIKPNKIKIDRLKKLLKNGIEIYWEETYAHGFSGDPW